jgi:hypothetical protein
MRFDETGERSPAAGDGVIAAGLAAFPGKAYYGCHSAWCGS